MKKSALAGLAVVACAFVIFPPSAGARLPQSARLLMAGHELAPQTQLRLADHTITYAANVLRFLERHPAAGTPRSRRVVRRDHRWLHKFGWSKHRQAVARLQLAALPAHIAGWRCLTYGAYPGAPHEGHGWNGQYSGPLQMTPTWMGISLPWASMSDLAVYRVAERVAAGQGWSYAWMAGQWPQTFPPCASAFGL